MPELAAVATALSSPVLVAHGLAVAICLALIAYAARHDEYTGARYFAVWLGANAFWIGVHTVGLATWTPATRVAIKSLSLAAVPVAALGWLLFTLAYSGRWRPSDSSVAFGLLCATAVGMVLLVATNSLHGFVFGDVVVESWYGVSVLAEFDTYWGYWLFMVYAYTLYIAGVAVLLDLVLSSNSLYRDQTVALVVAVAIPLAVASLFVGDAMPVPVDPTPLAFGSVALPLAYSVFHDELLALVPASTREGEQTAIATLDQGVLVLDPRDRVAFANASAAELVEADQQTIVGRSLERILASSPLEPAPDWTAEQSTAADGHRVGSSDERATGPASSVGGESVDADDGSVDAGDGRTGATSDDADPTPIGDGAGVPHTLVHAESGRTYEVLESRVDDSPGPELGRTLFVRDVTEERRRKQRLLVLNRVVRHNLRNDMNVLRGHVRLLEDEVDDESVAVIDEIATDLIRLGEKAHQMDRIVREASGDGSPVNVAGIVDRVVRREEQESDVGIEVSGPAQAWTTSHGPIVEAIVSNLVENAVEHAPGDEPVTVEIDAADDGAVTLAVADDGPGVPEQEVATLMGGEVSALQHGSGIGLWMVKWCVDLANGTWRIDTDDGTRVTVRFPSGAGGSSGDGAAA